MNSFCDRNVQSCVQESSKQTSVVRGEEVSEKRCPELLSRVFCED